MKLLIIEDEVDIAKPLQRALERDGFVVDFAEDGNAGLSLASVNQYDCILLDLNLPGIDGIELCNKLREQQITTPVIMVTARSQRYDKLTGFDTGADDYITKPFDYQELVARVKSIIRRNSYNKENKLELDDMTLDIDRNLLTDGKNNVELSNKETKILEYLLRNKGKFISAEELLEHVWDSEIDIFTDTVKTHIKTLRKKVDPKKKLIRTLRGKGYIIE